MAIKCIDISKISRSCFLFAGTALLSLTVSCGTEESEDDDETTASTWTQVSALLDTNCKSCHSSGGVASTSWNFTGTSATDYATIAARVNTSTPADSTLLQKASNSVTHSGSSSVVWSASSTEYQSVLSWITAGAQNN